jgi:DNA mismatch repair ATPase MutS
MTQHNGKDYNECGNTTALVLEANKTYHCATIGLYESNDDAKHPYDCDEKLRTLSTDYTKPEIKLYSRYQKYFGKSYNDCENEIRLDADIIKIDGRIVNDLLDKKLKELESENKDLKSRVERLEKMIEEMFKYSPGQEGYEEAKKDFDERLKKF